MPVNKEMVSTGDLLIMAMEVLALARAEKVSKEVENRLNELTTAIRENDDKVMGWNDDSKSISV